MCVFSKTILTQLGCLAPCSSILPLALFCRELLPATIPKKISKTPLVILKSNLLTFIYRTLSSIIMLLLFYTRLSIIQTNLTVFCQYRAVNFKWQYRQYQFWDTLGYILNDNIFIPSRCTKIFFSPL